MTWIAPTDEEATVIDRVREALDQLGYPPTYTLPRKDLETIENYIQRATHESRERWVAAGKPDEWPENMIPYAGKHCGPMFKGVELLDAESPGMLKP